jgi:hypothetical protein
MATLIADLDATDADRVHRRLSAIAAGLASTAAAAGEPDSRTRDQMRADVLVDILLGRWHPAGTAAVDTGTSRPPDPGPAGTTPQVQVIVTLATLLGLAEDPAEIPGMGPVPAAVARELAADGRWQAWIADAAGSITATGRANYVPDAALARLVRAREPRCRFPGCHQPATHCDLDHAIPWPRGATTPENLGPLCRRHHSLKTHTPWFLEPDHASPQACSPDPESRNDLRRSSPSAEPSPQSRNGPGHVTELSPGPGHPSDVARPCPDPGPRPGPDASPGPSRGWRWRTPAGFVVNDGPQPPLQHLTPTDPRVTSQRRRC